MPPQDIIFYAADPGDYQIALAAAATVGVPFTNVSGNFYNIWSSVGSGLYLVIAVGRNANSALYLNPCGWSNPANRGGGSTPFAYAPEPATSLPGSDYYQNGAGESGPATLKLAIMLAYFAMSGTYPPGFGSTLPVAVAASSSCNTSMFADQACPC